MRRIQKGAVILVVVLLFSGLVQFCFANVFPDPGSDLPRIYIKHDGDVEPVMAPIERTGSVYTLTDNIVCYTVEIQCDNIIFDDAGYTIQGNSSRLGYDEGKNGVIVAGQNNVTITGITFERGDIGVRVSDSSNINIHGNSFINRLTTGVATQDSSFVLIEKQHFY